MSYRLIGHPQSRTMRVMWMLEEADQSYDLVPAMPATAEAREANPSGKIPALQTGGATITDSVAIIQFLADRHDVATFPAGTIERARQDAITQFIVEEIDGPLWLKSKHSFVLPADHRVEPIKDTARREFATGIERLSTMLDEGPYLMGEHFTVPDILASHCLGWARAAKMDVTDEAVLAYGKTCRARPAFRRALERASDAAKG